MYAGYRNSIGAWSYNFGGYGYYYVHTVGVNYAEGFGNLTYDFGFAQVTGGIYASPDNAFNSGTEVWGGGDIVVPVWKSLALDFHGGHQYIEKNANFGTPDYNEFSIAANALGSRLQRVAAVPRHGHQLSVTASAVPIFATAQFSSASAAASKLL